MTLLGVEKRTIGCRDFWRPEISENNERKASNTVWQVAQVRNWAASTTPMCSLHLNAEGLQVGEQLDLAKAFRPTPSMPHYWAAEENKNNTETN